MADRGEKLQQPHCYHPFSDSRDTYLTKNHYENYSPEMVPTNPTGSWTTAGIAHTSFTKDNVNINGSCWLTFLGSELMFVPKHWVIFSSNASQRPKYSLCISTINWPGTCMFKPLLLMRLECLVSVYRERGGELNVIFTMFTSKFTPMLLNIPVLFWQGSRTSWVMTRANTWGPS